MEEDLHEDEMAHAQAQAQMHTQTHNQAHAYAQEEGARDRDRDRDGEEWRSLSRVSNLPLVNSALRVYEHSKASSRVVKVRQFQFCVGCLVD